MTRRLRLALLGDPVAHSRSPVIHRAAMAATGLEGDYQAITADESTLVGWVDDLREGVVHGLNITMPLKSAAATLADKMTPLARESASVNTLRARDGLIVAHSTDAVAFREIFEDRDRFAVGAPILVLGAGGSARALLAAVKGREIRLSARATEKAEELGAKFDDVEVLEWGAIADGAIVVNATPIGMHGEQLPEGVLSHASALVDLPYGDDDTPAIVWAQRTGIPFADGIEFLARQAAASFEWWTGKPVDSMLLARAARNV